MDDRERHTASFSASSRVDVAVTRAGAEPKLSVCDDGRGFVADGAPTMELAWARAAVRMVRRASNAAGCTNEGK